MLSLAVAQTLSAAYVPLANLEGNPETAKLLQQAITARQAVIEAVTDKGRKYIENPPLPSAPPSTPPSAPSSATPPTTPPATPPDPPPPEPLGEEQPETIPSQADLFKAEGQRIGFGSRKGG